MPKKKRADNKSGAKGGDAAPVVVQPNDKHHNASFPCSSVAATIALEIFPTAALPSADGESNDCGSARDAAKASDSSAAGEPTAEIGSPAAQEEQPLLGYMIQKYLIEERKRTRGDGGEGGNKASSAKKRKNKKKKKKKAAAAASAPEGEPRQEGESDSEEVLEGGDWQSAIAPIKRRDNSLDNAVSGSVMKKLEASPIISMSPEPSPQNANGAKDKHVSVVSPKGARSELDRFLDSIVDSKSDSGGAADGAGRGNRDLEAFSAFLVRKFETYLKEQRQAQTQQKKDKSKSSLASLGSNPGENRKCSGIEFKDVLPTIPIQEIRDKCSAAECRTCRTSAMTRLRTLMPGDSGFHFSGEGFEIMHRPVDKAPPIFLNAESAKVIAPLPAVPKGYSLSVPISCRHWDELDHAFDYVSMDDVDLEAGEGGTEVQKPRMDRGTFAAAPSPFHLEMHPMWDNSEKERFLQIGVVLNEGEIGGGHYPISMQDMIDLAKNVLLPCGLGQLDDGTGNPKDLSEKEKAAISSQTTETLNSFRQEIQEIRVQRGNMDLRWQEVEEANSLHRSYQDMKTAGLLNATDDACGELWEQLGSFLSRLFKSTCFVGWSSEYGFSLMELFLKLWGQYNDALCQLVKPVLEFQGKLLQMATRDGQVPPAYSNTVVRQGLAEVVKTKIAVLNAFVNYIMTSLGSLSGGEAIGACPLIQLAVLEAYRQQTESPEVTVHGVFPDQEGLDLFHGLIHAQIACQQVIKNTSLEKVLQNMKKRREDINSCCKRVRTIVIAMEDLAKETNIEFLASSYATLESSWYELERMANEDSGYSHNKSQGVTQRKTKEYCIFLQKSCLLMSQWLVQLTARQCHESSMTSYSLPQNIKLWMQSFAEQQRVEDDMTNMPMIGPLVCEGLGGERRVSSIMAALLYRWLEARCSEWHAELTRDELLQSMDLDEPTAVTPREGGNKGGKKKKSKRKSAGNGGKNKNDKMNTSPAAPQESSTDAGDKMSVVVDESDVDAEADPAGKIDSDSEDAEDEKKCEAIEEGVIDKTQNAETESVTPAESVATVEGIGIEVSPEEIAAAAALEAEWKQKKSLEEGEWKEKKSKRKSGGGNKARPREESTPSRSSAAEKPSTRKTGKRQDLAPSDRPESSAKVEKTGRGPVSAATVEKTGRGADEDGAKTSPQRQPPAKEVNGKPGGSRAGARGKAAKAATPPTTKETQRSSSGPSSSEQPLQGGATPDDEPPQEMVDDGIGHRPTVGVADGKQIVTAEVYLVNRLRAITRPKGVVWI